LKKLTDFYTNKNNPRKITKSRLEKLKASLVKLQKMLAYRPIVANSDGKILGGNQRYVALVALGYTEVPDEWIKIADDLTPEEQELFVIEDNMPFGEWDWDILSPMGNEYLIDVGFDADFMTAANSDVLAIGAILNNETEEPAAPDDFAEYDESIDTQYECPKCGYRWSGKQNQDEAG